MANGTECMASTSDPLRCIRELRICSVVGGAKSHAQSLMAKSPVWVLCRRRCVAVTHGCPAPANRQDWSSKATRNTGSGCRWQTATTVHGLPLWSNTIRPAAIWSRGIHPSGGGWRCRRQGPCNPQGGPSRRLGADGCPSRRIRSGMDQSQPVLADSSSSGFLPFHAKMYWCPGRAPRPGT